MNEELKPCPFCGWKKVTIAGKKVIRGYLWDRGVNKHIFYVKCNKCHARGGSASGLIPTYITKCKMPKDELSSYEEIKNAAIKAWNRRENDGKID